MTGLAGWPEPPRPVALAHLPLAAEGGATCAGVMQRGVRLCGRCAGCGRGSFFPVVHEACWYVWSCACGGWGRRCHEVDSPPLRRRRRRQASAIVWVGPAGRRHRRTREEGGAGGGEPQHRPFRRARIKSATGLGGRSHRGHFRVHLRGAAAHVGGVSGGGPALQLMHISAVAKGTASRPTFIASQSPLGALSFELDCGLTPLQVARHRLPSKPIHLAVPVPAHQPKRPPPSSNRRPFIPLCTRMVAPSSTWQSAAAFPPPRAAAVPPPRFGDVPP